jgi:hypothetical protein
VSDSVIDPTVVPSGTGCVECLEHDGWWFHLRRCAACGHIGCCDSSPMQHARVHAAEAGHPLTRSFEPDESADWNFQTNEFATGPELSPPAHRPRSQPAPGPAGRVPADWRAQLH